MAEHAEENKQVFRQKTLERISSPEQLTDYLRVTNPGIWVALAAVILLLAGILVWSLVGSLETKAQATVVVKDRQAQVITAGSEELAAGMPLTVEGRSYTLAAVEKDAYGRISGLLAVDLPDGSYEGSVVIDSVRPIDFLLRSR